MIDPLPQPLPQVTLEGHGLRLEPLEPRHADGLREAAADGALWTLRVTSVPTPEGVEAYIDAALDGWRTGQMLPFAIVDATSGRVLGSSRYHDVLAAVRRVEIGYTWIRRSAQRSAVNSACKLLLMAHAFDTLGCGVVGWRTDLFNVASQRAIERLGARRDGTLRGHALRRDGTVRDTVMYSMSADEWPAARARLLARLAAGGFGDAPPSDAPLALRAPAELDAAQYGRWIDLHPGALGERMVAPNALSVAQAARSSCAWLRAICAGERPVGLLMFYDPSLDPARAAAQGKALDTIMLWRLMIEFAAQGRGYGARALALALRHAATRPGIAWVETSHMPWEGHPGPFYEAFGLAYTGAVDEDGERIMRAPLARALEHADALLAPREPAPC
jgi:RimJ/RimL family protein N-acetyltransferase